MDDTPCRLFFLQPAGDPQLLYEALRAVFVDGCRQKDVAERFGLGFDAFRQQVHQFRSGCAMGQPPPFSLHARAAAPRRPRQSQDSQNVRPSPTAASATWLQDSALGPAALASSSSCLCSPKSGLTTSSAKLAIPAQK